MNLLKAFKLMANTIVQVIALPPYLTFIGGVLILRSVINIVYRKDVLVITDDGFIKMFSYFCYITIILLSAILLRQLNFISIGG